ncbi:MAG: response regulator, partial [Chloroflexota bacterium]|nr:response regulator [Chloroflexota bacterium]
MTRPQILVVEDEGVVALELQSRLEAMGYAVVGLAASGEAAVEKAAALTPDLVLMDIRLKGKLDGVMATEQIRTRFHLPVVFLTAFADEQTLQRAKVSEPYGYVLKPFEERALQIAIEIALYKHRMQRALVESEQRLAITLDSIGDAVIATDADGQITLLNRPAEALTGWSQATAQGKRVTQIFQLLDEKTRCAVEHPLDGVLRHDPTVTQKRDNLLTMPGGERLVEHQAVPVQSETGQLSGIVFVLRDVTQQRKAEAELLKAQRLESLGLLAGGIAHQFNNLLAVIISNLALIKLQIGKEQPVHTKLETVEKTAWKAADVARQLLTFSSGGAPLRKATPIGDVVTTAANLVLKMFPVQCQFVLPAHLWLADVDPGQITQVFTNLLLNAQQAMPNGGLIQVRAENTVVEARVGAGAEPALTAGRYLKISVQDQGAGIPPPLLAKIFDPYFSTKPGAGGLGLTTAYSIVSRHHGQITVESNDDTGATFSVYLPAAAPADPPEVADQPAAVQLNTRRKKVLLMDD